MGNAANLDRVLRATESTSLTADFRAGVHALMTADCRSEPDAQNLSAQLNGLLGLLRMYQEAAGPAARFQWYPGDSAEPLGEGNFRYFSRIDRTVARQSADVKTLIKISLITTSVWFIL